MGKNTLEKVAGKCIYRGYTLKVGEENQTAEINIRLRMTWAAAGKLGFILKDSKVPINLKREVFNVCILPVLRYGMETMPLTLKSATNLKRTQRSIKRVMVGISLRDKITNHEIRQRTGVEDITERVARNKWIWAGFLER
ncbi:hypothetical protein Trydic_g20916 [Trypoxylus dichotomus]